MVPSARALPPADAHAQRGTARRRRHHRVRVLEARDRGPLRHRLRADPGHPERLHAATVRRRPAARTAGALRRIHLQSPARARSDRGVRARLGVDA